MDRLEKACSDAENAAESARKSATGVASQARALTKAAKTGNIAAIRRAQEKLSGALAALELEVSNAVSSWPFTEEEEQRHFDERYAAELKAAAAEKGLSMYERDGVFISYPSIVRIVPAERAVRVDRKKVSTVRPTHLVDLLLQNQGRTSGFTEKRFLESLYAVYRDIDMAAASGGRPAGSGRVVPLARIYKLMTALPGAAREYDRSDFARDLYNLDSNGPRSTRSGAVMSLSASTGTRRRSSDVFSFIGPNGGLAEYYGIRFRTAAE